MKRTKLAQSVSQSVSQRKKRNSNIELLRMMMMLVIIIHHFAVHGIVEPMELAQSVTVANFSWPYFLVQLVGWGGNMANDVFMLITGYFMVVSGVHYKRIVRLMLRMFFYAWLIAGLFLVFKVDAGNWDYYRPLLIRSTVPIWFGLNWYVCCYILFSLFVPFLNPFLRGLAPRHYLRLLGLTFALYVVMPLLHGTNFLGGARMVEFFLLYAAGGFLRLHLLTRERFLSHRLWRRVLLTLVGGLLLSMVAFDLLGILTQQDRFLRHAWYLVPLFNAPIAVALFLFVRTRSAFFSARINFLAGSVLGIYLLHDNLLVRGWLWNELFPNQELLLSPYFPLLYAAKVLAVFGVCLAIDIARRKWVPGLPLFRD